MEAYANFCRATVQYGVQQWSIQYSTVLRGYLSQCTLYPVPYRLCTGPDQGMIQAYDVVEVKTKPTVRSAVSWHTWDWGEQGVELQHMRTTNETSL